MSCWSKHKCPDLQQSRKNVRSLNSRECRRVGNRSKQRLDGLPTASETSWVVSAKVSKNVMGHSQTERSLLCPIPWYCKIQRMAASCMPSIHVWTNTEACRVYLEPCSVHVTWKTLLPSDRHDQSVVWINLTDKGAVEAETTRFSVYIQQKVFSKFKNLITQLKRLLAYLILWEKERRTKRIITIQAIYTNKKGEKNSIHDIRW